MADRPFIPDRFRPVIARLEDALDSETAAAVPDLPGYLEARWDEEEATAQLAQHCAPTPWRCFSGRKFANTAAISDENAGDIGRCGGCGEQAEFYDSPAIHIAYWDPARVLADLAAKRALLAYLTSEGHRETSDFDTGEFPCEKIDDPTDDCTCGYDWKMATVLGPFAQVYAMRPDFPEDFRA